MFDLHYDLLTYIYANRKNLKVVKKHCKKIFNNNIGGGIFNLFYMSPNEMKEELGIEKEEINIIKNLKTADRLIKENKLIPRNIKYIYGIEGLDYLNKIDDLEEIYKLGVRSVNIVWNNDNKFGGGVRGNKNRGLTILGKELVKELINKNIAIDLSHSNEKTFYDIIKICKEQKNKGKNPIVIASHSNIKDICNAPRNLTCDQIIKIKSLDGIIGIVGVKPFCLETKKEVKIIRNKYNLEYKNAYIKHIIYLKKLLGSVDNIGVATDDMTYYKTNKKYYKHYNVFKQEQIKKELEQLLLENNFTIQEIEKIMYLNFENKILGKM